MSIYSRYQEAIKSQLILNHEEMNFKSDSNYTYMLEHVDNNLGHTYLHTIKNNFKQFYESNFEFYTFGDLKRRFFL